MVPGRPQIERQLVHLVPVDAREAPLLGEPHAREDIGPPISDRLIASSLITATTQGDEVRARVRTALRSHSDVIEREAIALREGAAVPTNAAPRAARETALTIAEIDRRSAELREP